MFSDNPEYLESFREIDFFSVNLFATNSQDQEAYMRGLGLAEAFLKARINEVKVYWDDDDEKAAVSPSKAITQLQNALYAIPELRELSYDSPQFKEWQENTKTTMFHVFSEKPERLESFREIDFFSANLFATNSQDQKAYLIDLGSAEAFLEARINEVKVYRPDDDEEKAAVSPAPQRNKAAKKVFIVHGRNEAAKEKVARFLEKLGVEHIILDEQPGQNDPIIQKFEKYAAQVGFAIVLMTADDVGAEKEEKNNLKPRARQNVILELGFFMGRLGRDRVCSLVEEGVDNPSDYAGVEYVPLDAGAWKLKLIRELQAAGFNVDANLAIDG